MSPAEFKKLLDRYFHGECTPQEVAFVEKWYENINGSKPLTERDADEAAARAWAIVKPARKLSTPLYLKIAAAVMLLAAVAGTLVISLFQPEESLQVASVTVTQVDSEVVETRNNTERSYQVALSDGSTVTLEPNSSIRYPQVFAAHQRVVELSGEAFFNVRKDPSKPFIVYSDEIVTKVLGTSFRITAFDDREEIVVAVKTGKVSVYQKPQSEQSDKMEDVILTPNQQMVFRRSEDVIVKQIVPAPAVVAVDSAAFLQMQFDGMPVTEIFTVLEKNYGIDIQYDEEVLQACVLTSKMTEEGFLERIDVICKAINAGYTVTDGAVVITGSGCN